MTSYPFLERTFWLTSYLKLPRCKKVLKESCVDIFDAIACRAASSFCEEEFIVPFIGSGVFCVLSRFINIC